MRYVGQGHEIEADLPAGRLGADAVCRLRLVFEDAYRRFYGRLIPGGEIECLAWSVTVGNRPPTRAARADETPAPVAPTVTPDGRRALVDPATGNTIDVPVYQRGSLPVAAAIDGPSIIAEDETTIIVPSTFNATVGPDGTIDCCRIGGDRP